MAISLTGPVQILNQLLGNHPEQRFSLEPSRSLRSSIELNQLVTGVVEKDLGNGRYLIQIHGENLVAQSKTPLKLNDVIHGRVIGIDDKVELQRVFKEKASANNQSAIRQNLDYLYNFGKAGYRAAVVLQNYRVNLTADEQLSLIAALKAAASQDAISLSAVVLTKLGLQVTEDGLNLLSPLLTSQLNQKFNLQEIAAQIGFDDSHKNPADHDLVKELANFIYSVTDRFPHQHDAVIDGGKVLDAPGQMDNLSQDMDMSDHQDQGQNKHFDAARILLNAQSDGSVSHRVSVVPFLINDQLVEVDVALFSQKHNANQLTNNHKRIVLSLDMDTLGKIDAVINIVGKHARISIDTENNIITNELVKYMPELKADFESNKFKIDELSYGVKQSDAFKNVLNSVVEHYITQDSLSRLY